MSLIILLQFLQIQGVYTGAVSKSNSTGLVALDEIKNTVLRGVRPISANGTASFLVIVPGQYTGRLNHQYIMARPIDSSFLELCPSHRLHAKVFP